MQCNAVSLALVVVVVVVVVCVLGVGGEVGGGGRGSSPRRLYGSPISPVSYLKTNQWQFVFSTLLATLRSFLRLSRHRGYKAGD